MLKFVQKKLKEEKGLTLIELLAVIVILGIIAAIAIPAIGNIIQNSRDDSLRADGQNALAAANLYFVDNGNEQDVTVGELVQDGFLDDPGSLDDAVLITKGTPAQGETAASSNEITSGSGTAGGRTITFSGATNSDLANETDTGYEIDDAS